jgi:4-amino-4-deoxy-L-arabinose transferase-like glycosyltransferase
VKTIRRIWFVSLIFKLVLAVFIPLSLDEAYYWVWSKNLQMSYLDHPPMVAWLLKCGQFLESLGHAVRWPSVVIGHLTFLVWIYILKEFLSLDRIKQWLYLALFSPLIGFGGLVATPDVPLLLFWSLCIYFFLKILESSKVTDFFLLGMAFGLGFCSKYHIVLFLPAAFLYLVFEKKWKRLHLHGLFVFSLTSLCFAAPVFIWNFQNDYKSFLFQIEHGLAQKNWDISWTVSYVIGQILLIFPTVLWLCLRKMVRGTARFILYASWFPPLFFFMSSFRGVVEPNWPLVAYPGLFALAVFNYDKIWPIRVAQIFFLILGVFIVTQAMVPIFKFAPERLNEVRYFDEIKPLAKEYSPLYLSSYQMASSFYYTFKKPFSKLYQMTRQDLFDDLTKGPPLEKNYYVIRERWVDFPSWLKSGPYILTKIKDVGEKFELFEVNKK